MKYILVILSTLLIQQFCVSQIDSLRPVQIKVESSIDLNNAVNDVPFSLSRKRYTATAQNAQQQLSLDEYLTGIPGLFILNRNNYAQDLRLSLRGFGARSAFGIRGIKIVVDGIPETTPDGQGQIDNLTLGIIENIRVLRGPASLLYGNAAGGVIDINTISQVDSSYVQAGYTLGNYAMQKIDATVAIKHKQGASILSATRTSTDGYRAFSGFESNQLNLKSSFILDNLSSLSLQLNYTDSPFASDSGGLTLEESVANRRQARDRNVQFDAGEQVRQFKTGANYQQRWEDLSLATYVFYSYRDFDNKLPFQDGGQVELYRNYYGNGAYLTYDANSETLSNKLQLGYAIAFQADLRRRFTNNDGARGDSDFNQLESYNTYGFYLIDRLQTGRWNFQGGLRYDINSLKADDRTMSMNDDSRNLNSFSGSLGLNYGLSDQDSFYASVGTSFETPALSELSANPDGSTGFNPDLEAQQAVNYEIGFKNEGRSFQWNAALFYIDTTDDLVPFELAQFQGRTFYRNAGSTRRSGLELFGNSIINRELSVNASYTYSNFEYADYQLESIDLEGKQLPGIPKHLATLGITYQQEKGIYAQLNTTYRGKLFADDANATFINSAVITDLNLSYPINWTGTTVSLIGGVNNLFNTSYFDNVRINAFGGRFYEPAPGINFYTGVRVRI